MKYKAKTFSTDARESFFNQIKEREYVGISLRLFPNPVGDFFIIEDKKYSLKEILNNEELEKIYCPYYHYQPISFRKIKERGLENLAEIIDKKIKVVKDDSGEFEDIEFQPLIKVQV